MSVRTAMTTERITARVPTRKTVFKSAPLGTSPDLVERERLPGLEVS
jgi:hypothetical protein